ncbi:MAG: cytochrome c oxidase subunit 3 family protein [Gemmataceae bacterium]
MSANHLPLEHHFENMEQQHDAGTLAMWLFLATEVLFFGALLTGYTAYRSSYPAEFAAASQHLKEMVGAVNTAVLICSSLTMALAVHAARTSQRRLLATCLVLTLLLGATFLGIKAWEWYSEYQESLVPGIRFSAEPFTGVSVPRAQMFFVFYFILTGLHGLHMIVGLGVLTVLLVRHRRYSAEYFTPIEVAGLYWHFVDIVWIFLFPLLYLVRN